MPLQAYVQAPAYKRQHSTPCSAFKRQPDSRGCLLRTQVVEHMLAKARKVLQSINVLRKHCNNMQGMQLQFSMFTLLASHWSLLCAYDSWKHGKKVQGRQRKMHINLIYSQCSTWAPTVAWSQWCLMTPLLLTWDCLCSELHCSSSLSWVETSWGQPAGHSDDQSVIHRFAGINLRVVDRILDAT